MQFIPLQDKDVGKNFVDLNVTAKMVARFMSGMTYIDIVDMVGTDLLSAVRDLHQDLRSNLEEHNLSEDEINLLIKGSGVDHFHQMNCKYEAFKLKHADVVQLREAAKAADIFDSELDSSIEKGKEVLRNFKLEIESLKNDLPRQQNSAIKMDKIRVKQNVPFPKCGENFCENMRKKQKESLEEISKLRSKIQKLKEQLATSEREKERLVHEMKNTKKK